LSRITDKPAINCQNWVRLQLKFAFIIRPWVLLMGCLHTINLALSLILYKWISSFRNVLLHLLLTVFCDEVCKSTKHVTVMLQMP